jgi:enoyl-CoA hydratase
MADDVVRLEYRADGRIGLLTLNRPHVHNAMNTELGAALADRLVEVDRARRCRAVILTGAGDRAFCAGGDLKERNGMTPAQWTAQHHVFERAFRLLRTMRTPIFAAVNGVAAGGGLEMAASTDFLICSQNARFGQPEVTRGIQPGSGGTQLLPRLIGRGMARQLLMTGELIDAAEAYRIGLVNSVHPPAGLLDAALGIAGCIVANSPAAVRQVRRAVALGVDGELERGVQIELETYQAMVDHPDRREGVTAFNERRPPKFADPEV